MYVCTYAMEKVTRERRIVTDKRGMVAVLNRVQGRLPEVRHLARHLKQG